MKKTSILLTNYPSIQEYASFGKIGGHDTINIRSGYDFPKSIDKKVVTNQIANDLILGLLAYDEVIIEASHFWDIIQVWGSNYIKELLRQRIIRIVNDSILNPVMLKMNSENWHVDFFPFTQSLYNDLTKQDIKFNHGPWNHIAVKFHRNNFKGIEAETILMLIDEGAKKIDENKILSIASKETKRDIESQCFYDCEKIENGIKWVGTSYERLIRLQELNKSCAIASIIDANSIRCDAEISSLLSKKTERILSKKYPDGISSFNQVLYQKKFPELGSLFVDGFISLDQILKLRENFNGRLFRYWMNQNAYEDSEMIADIMNSTSGVIGSKASQILRLVSCNLLGIFGFVPGIVASAIDSFILNKMAMGWHPNFFLDDRVKKIVDESIRRQEEKEKRSKYSNLFQGINRNDKCPCGSGLKFKKCHGRLL